MTQSSRSQPEACSSFSVSGSCVGEGAKNLILHNHTHFVILPIYDWNLSPSPCNPHATKQEALLPVSGSSLCLRSLILQPYHGLLRGASEGVHHYNLFQAPSEITISRRPSSNNFLHHNQHAYAPSLDRFASETRFRIYIAKKFPCFRIGIQYVRVSPKYVGVPFSRQRAGSSRVCQL